LGRSTTAKKEEGYIMSNDRMLIFNEPKRICKEVVVACLRYHHTVCLWRLTRTMKKHKVASMNECLIFQYYFHIVMV